MKQTEDWKTFGAAVMDTPIGAIAVKKRGKSFQELCDDKCGHGLLVSPAITVGMIHGPNELGEMLQHINQSIVKVRGHGWQWETPFVWTGSVAEFNATWMID